MQALLLAGCEGTQRTFERDPNADVSEAVGGLDPAGPNTASGMIPGNGAGAAETPGNRESLPGQLQTAGASPAGTACSESPNSLTATAQGVRASSSMTCVSVSDFRLPLPLVAHAPMLLGTARHSM
jgi:hypothetical protein